jgi:glycosyltransferase involved in cell wall biosynthesis
MCQSLDLAILPYDRWFYGQAVSGIFTLLAGIGVPCVVPSSTWMSDRITADETVGVVYEGNSAEDISARVEGAIVNIAQIASACRARSKHWREKYSGDAVVGEIIKFASIQTSSDLT